MLPFIGDIVKNATSGLDSLFTSDEERLRAQGKIKAIQAEIEKSLNNHMSDVVKAQTEVYKLDMKHGNWLTKSWRPILFLSMTFILLWNFCLLDMLLMIRDQFQLNFWVPSKIEFQQEFWWLLTAGLTGGIVGRSLEKRR